MLPAAGPKAGGTEVTLTGELLGGTTQVLKIDATQSGDRLVAVGNFATAALHQTGVSFCTREHFGRRQLDEDRQYIRLAYSGIDVADIRDGLGRLREWIETA